MGAWVLRSDEPIDLPALRTAMAQLIERHPSLRAEIRDPLHYMSVLYDAAVLWTLVNPFFETFRFRLAQAVKKIISWAHIRCWPRVRCRTREEIYKQRFPEDLVPLEVLGTQGPDGQAFE